MFHCLEQTEGEGGANLWVDAFHVAHLLYQEHPESFQVLVDASVVFHNFTKTRVGQMYNRSRHPLIRLVILLPTSRILAPWATFLSKCVMLPD